MKIAGSDNEHLRNRTAASTIVAFKEDGFVLKSNRGETSPFRRERARSFMQETGQPFEVALAATRAGNLFTTHTAVPAGFDRFTPSLIEHYLGAYAGQKLGMTLLDLLAPGRRNPNDTSESFNMAYLAIHGNGALNGVRRLPGKVSRNMIFKVQPEEKPDTVARFGGDEFVLVLPEQKDARSALLVAQKIIDAFRNAVVLDGHALTITCSIGISLYPDHGADIDTILKNVDNARYQSKQMGRNHYQLYKVGESKPAVQ